MIQPRPSAPEQATAPLGMYVARDGENIGVFGQYPEGEVPQGQIVTFRGATLGVGDTIVMPWHGLEGLGVPRNTINHHALGGDAMRAAAGLEPWRREIIKVAETDPRAQAALGWLRRDAPPSPIDRYLPPEEEFNVTGQGISIITQIHPVEIPVSSIVQVPDMSSWHDLGNKDKPYIEKRIRQLRRHPEEQLPPINGLARVYVQPDGQSFVAMLSNGAHSVVIARGSGRETVQLFGEIHFVNVNSNLFPPIGP